MDIAMCYRLFLSTSSPEDLTRYNSEWVRFRRPDVGDSLSTTALENTQQWFVGSMDGCSCRFRHLADGDLGFGEPQDWMEEDEDSIRATRELYRAIASLVRGGHKVDCLDLWQEMEPVSIHTMSVRLSEVPAEAFRLFEGHHFVFEP
jgi:hypothetical protein